jgi:cation:H+ antiporter
METFPPWLNSGIVLATFFAIAIGAKYVVDSAAALAHRARVSELVVGLTVVALGTSAPEFGVTLVAAFEGRSSISVGNIVGSNIFNLGFILGGAALVRAIPTSILIVWRDAIVLVGATVVLFLLVGIDLELGVLDGAVLFLLLLAYLRYIWVDRKNGAPSGHEATERKVRASTFKDAPWKEGVLLVVGLTTIGVASHFLIGSASALARSFGVSEWTIAVTIVAAGTSVPEFATTLAGVVRGRTAISAGTVIGSDIFNLLGVLGVAGLLHPMSLAPAARTSLLALTGMVFVVFIMMRTNWRLSRTEGLILIMLAAFRWALDFATRV